MGENFPCEKGVGELDKTALTAPSSENLLHNSRPFVVLDVRDADSYSREHISLAVSYPAIR